jgi:hypothetical protein
MNLILKYEIDMIRQQRILVSLFVLFWTSLYLNGQNCDSSSILIVRPYTEINCPTNPSEPLDVSIIKFNLARKIYDALSLPRFKKTVDLRSRYDEVMELTKIIKDYKGKEFISGALKIIPYTPDLFLFSSIDKETDKVVLREEILDLTTKFRAVAIRKISFPDFLNDEITNAEVNQLANDLLCNLCGCFCKPFGFISLKEYRKTLDKYNFNIALGFGFSAVNEATLENIPREIRTIPPNSDDVKYRANDILPVDIPDNYLVRENSVDLNLGNRFSLDITLSYLGIINLAIKTTSINESGQIPGQNLFKKWYVTNNINNPDDPNSGTAYIYYSIKSKNRIFFTRNSISLPLIITYPVLYAGRKKEIICKLVGGTNLLLPSEIEFESEKGWYRFGAYQIQDKSSIGYLKEIEWYTGIDIIGNISKRIKVSFQWIRVYSEYKGDFKVPLSFKLESNVTSSLRLSWIGEF